jgi:hypothetical protein
MSFKVSKDQEVYADFKNANLPWLAKCSPKKIKLKNWFFLQ